MCGSGEYCCRRYVLSVGGKRCAQRTVSGFQYKGPTYAVDDVVTIEALCQAGKGYVKADVSLECCNKSYGYKCKDAPWKVVTGNPDVSRIELFENGRW